MLPILRFIKNILFVPRCVFCDRVLEPNSRLTICGECVGTDLICSCCVCCEKCGKPIVGFGEKQLCVHCADKKSSYYNRAAAVFIYEGEVRNSILRYKLGHISAYAKTYAEFMAARLNDVYSGIEFDFICGAPPHKINNFGELDHTGLICREVSKLIKTPFLKNVLERKPNIKRQSELSSEGRRKNLENNIFVGSEFLEKIKDKTILLIDDISTTRSTLKECSRALKAGGAKAVYALTLATTRDSR